MIEWLADAFFVAVALLMIFAVVALYRAFRGPTMQDRVIAVNVIGTNIVLVIVLVAGALDEPGFLDIAIVYGLLNFVMSIAISKFTVERGGVI